jgi:hypothetical protein
MAEEILAAATAGRSALLVAMGRKVIIMHSCISLHKITKEIYSVVHEPLHGP